jgi:CDP-diacylglycerol--serine O-phosphatidyltransferase
MHILPNPPPVDDSDAPPPRHKYKNAQEAARIYFLPNLFTAGNLFFGFVAIIRCIQAKYVAASPLEANDLYTDAVWCILFAAFCDALDGRLARLGGRESLFGMEFDSIADTVSFGVAPALMVYFLILADPPSASSPILFSDIFQQIGWVIGFIYLLCVAVRLARFNVITNPLLPGVSANASTKDFMGLPSPAAAGFVASLVLAMLHLDFEKQTIQQFTMLLPPLLLLVALLMISNIPYPSFKHIDWQTQTKARPFIFVIIAITVAYRLRFYSPAIFFLCYIFYGLFRDWRRSARRKQQPPPPPDPDEPDAEEAF